MNPADWLASRAYASPEKVALIIGDSQWTYAKLDRLVNGFCARLLDLGVEPGQFVGVFMPNNLAYVCLIHALARLGAVLVPLNTRLTAPELAWQVEHVGCKLVLAAGGENWSLVTGHWSLVDETWLEETSSFTIHDSQFTIHNLQSVVFTSGTSGKPKAAMLTFGNHFYSAMGSAYKLGVLPDDMWLSCLPLYHVGGLAVIFRSCLYGTAVDLHPKFDVEAMNHSLDNKPITLISLVPTMLHRLLETRTDWPMSLRLILLGGAAASPELVERANALPRMAVFSDQYSVISEQSRVNSEKFTIHDSPFTIHNSPLVAPTYGLTEAASQVTTMLPEEAQRKPGSVGKPLLFTEVKIVDGDGRTLPPNTYGEIIITGPTVMAGYVASGQVAGGKWQVAGGKWQVASTDQSDLQPATCNLQPATFHTGDIGYLDDDGDLWVIQRRSDLIVSGGENVYPAEVEAVLKSHPAVANACVVGLPDGEWGQRVAAMVVLREGTAVTSHELTQFCRERLAGYKQPRQIHFTDSLPLNAMGKIDRELIVQMFGNWVIG
jgi:O-succinylbenzoic acid--CoA ligase